MTYSAPSVAIARVSPGAPFPPRALWAIAGAFGARSPVTLVAHAVARAAVQEARWLSARPRHRAD